MRRFIRNVALLTAAPSAWDATWLRAEPIHDAARKGDVAEVRRLLEQDPALVNLTETAMNSGVTPLHYAAENGHRDVVAVLLARGAAINARGTYGTALEAAAFYGHRDVAQLLLNKGARLDIFTAAGLGDVGDMGRLLRADKSLVDVTDADWRTALHWAAFTGQKAAAELLLAQGAKVDPQTRTWGAYGKDATPLHYAAWAGEKQIAELLLQHGANVEARDDYRRTPLHVAAWAGRADVAKLLIAHGADVNARADRYGTCPIIAFRPSNAEPLRPSQTTPLHLAAEQGSVDLVKLLLAGKADVNAREWGDVTPLRLTKSGAVAELLRAAGATE